MDKISISVKNSEKQYEIMIGKSIPYKLASYLEKNHSSKKVAIITDDNLKPICNQKIADKLKGISSVIISIPPGEKSKSREMKAHIEDQLLGKKFGRDSVIVAVGGGVVGDISGFVASTYNRGIPLIHVPTTLLAMVDSSIGGKTSVNTEHGKNLIGSFYHPEAVFIDLDFLETIPKEELVNGLAESIKMAVSMDSSFFNFIENNVQKILKKDSETLTFLIKKSIELKKNVIEQDEKEQGQRQVLNFGHTFGHAYEKYFQYTKKHGYCIGLGQLIESRISNLIGSLPIEDVQRLSNLLVTFGLPINLDKSIDIEKLIELMSMDKKSLGNVPQFVILKGIGMLKNGNGFSEEIDKEIIRKAIELSR
jgi:3-dehydroquinate synthase